MFYQLPSLMNTFIEALLVSISLNKRSSYNQIFENNSNQP